MRQEIANLEKIINRTPQQERELQEKKEKLAQLENQQQSGESGGSKKPNSTYLWIFGVVVFLLVLGIIIYFLLKSKKNATKSSTT